MLKDLTEYLSTTKLAGVPPWQLLMVGALTVLLVLLIVIQMYRFLRGGKASKQSSRAEDGFYREFKERLQYHVDNWFARGASAQFGLLLFATVFVTLIGMSAALFGLFGGANFIL